MKHQVQFEKKWFKIQETVFYIVAPIVAYFYMKSATNINPYGYIIMVLGFISFFTAKLSLIRKGIYFSIGCDEMSTKMMILYGLGYILMITGFVVTF